MANSIFILSTPTQAYYLSFIPQLVKDAILIVTVPSEEKADAICDVLKGFRWQEKYTWIVPKSNSRLETWKVLWIRVQFELLKQKIYSAENIFMGSCTNIYHLSVAAEFEQKAKVHLLYDGLGVLTFANARKNGETSIKRFPKLYKMLGYKEPNISNLTFVAPYELEVGTEDSFLKIETNEKHQRDIVLLEDQVFFIGQPLLEIGIISRYYYFKSLKWIIEQNPGKKVVYIPHPRERTDNLQEVAKIMPVKKLNMVFEEYYLTSEVFPKKVVSYCSSVLLNLFFFEGAVEIEALKVPQDEIRLKKYMQPFNNIYEFFENLKSPLFKTSSLPKSF